MNCPLYHDEEKILPPENPERWNPPSAIIGASFQLHDHVLLLYRTAHVVDPAGRKKALATSVEAIEATMRFIKKEIEKL